MKTKTVAWERFEKVEAEAKEALRLAVRLAAKHDPYLEKRIAILERQMKRVVKRS